jgi:hypothetical protein
MRCIIQKRNCTAITEVKNQRQVTFKLASYCHPKHTHWRPSPWEYNRANNEVQHVSIKCDLNRMRGK